MGGRDMGMPGVSADPREIRDRLEAACRRISELFREMPLSEPSDASLAHTLEAETALSFFALSQLCPPGFFAGQLRLLEQGHLPEPRCDAADGDDAPWKEAQWPQLAALTRTALGRAGLSLFSPRHLSGPAALGVCLRAFLDMPPLDRDCAARLLLEKLNDFAAGRGRALRFGVVPSWLARLMAGLAGIRPGESLCDCLAGEGSLLSGVALGLPLADRVYCTAREASTPLGVLLLHLSGIPAVLPARDEHSLRLSENEIGESPAREIEDGGSCHVALSAGPAFLRSSEGTVELDGVCRHVSEALAATGRAVLLTRLGPLFRENEEASVRSRLVERNLLDVVIQLPSNVVHQHNAAHALLVFDRRREAGGPRAGEEGIFMADFSGQGRRSRSLTYFEEAHVRQALELATARQESSGVCRCVPRDAVLRQNVWLPSRYLLSPSTGSQERVRQYRARVAAFESELQATEARVDALLARLERISA